MKAIKRAYSTGYSHFVSVTTEADERIYKLFANGVEDITELVVKSWLPFRQRLSYRFAGQVLEEIHTEAEKQVIALFDKLRCTCSNIEQTGEICPSCGPQSTCDDYYRSERRLGA